jgi:hypothetical protein
MHHFPASTAMGINATFRQIIDSGYLDNRKELFGGQYTVLHE